MGRISTTFNAFTFSLPNPAPGILPPLFDPSGPLSPVEQTAGMTTDQRQKCPGANERNPGDDSTPFTENGKLDCDPTDVPPGP